MAIALNGTTGISGVDGSASAPALQGTDSNTGINFASDTVNINTGGTTRATIDSSGNLGVGETSPLGKIHAKSADSGGSAAVYADELVLEGSGDSGMTILSGTSSDSSINFGDSGSNIIGRLVYNHNSNHMQFNTGGSETMSLRRNGSHAQVFMNCTESFSNAMFSLQTNGTTGIGIKTGATNQQFCINFRNPNGEVGTINTSGSGTSYNTSSDYRLKENAVAISDGISRLKTLIPYRFNFKADATTTVDGFFAHEVTAVPEAITGTKDEVDSDNNPVYQGIDQSKLVPLLTAALQEAIAKIETLETKVAALEAG